MTTVLEYIARCDEGVHSLAGLTNLPETKIQDAVMMASKCSAVSILGLLTAWKFLAAQGIIAKELQEMKDGAQ